MYADWVNRGANALVGSTTADVAAHRRIDVGVGRLRLLLEQRNGGHDLAGLAIAALHDVGFDPRTLHGMLAVLADAFDGGDFLAGERRDRRDARTHRHAVDMHGAGAALGHAAAELGAGQADQVAQHPEQRHVAGRIDFMLPPVDVEFHRTPRSVGRGSCARYSAQVKKSIRCGTSV